MKQYLVTCLKCKKGDTVYIKDDHLVDQRTSTTNNIISYRKRLDNQWGFECLCGNNDLLTEQEQRSITNLQNPDPMEIAEVVRNLKPQSPKFVMALTN